MNDHWHIVVSAEHASRDVPEGLGDLGVGADVFDSHVVWDPGAAEVASLLAKGYGDAPLILGSHSRLVADLNRSPTNLEAVPPHAFGVDVPGNTGLTETERAARMLEYHEPYWDWIRDQIRAGEALGKSVLHWSIHSFTPIYQGQYREVDIGLLIDPDREIDHAISDQLKAVLRHEGFVVQFNEPYDGRMDGLTTAMRNEFAADLYIGLEIEINQRYLPRLDSLASELTEVILNLDLPTITRV